MKFFFLTTLLLLMILMTGCEFFSSPQERRGVNPKPFNSQTNWENTSYGTYQN